MKKIGCIKIRIVNVELKNGTIETLATNLTNEEFNSDEFGWKCEYISLFDSKLTTEYGFFESKKIPMRFTYTNSMLTEEDLDDEYCNFITAYAENKGNEILVNSPISDIEKVLRQNITDDSIRNYLVYYDELVGDIKSNVETYIYSFSLEKLIKVEC